MNIDLSMESKDPGGKTAEEIKPVECLQTNGAMNCTTSETPHLSTWAEGKLAEMKPSEKEALEEIRKLYETKKPKLAKDTNTLLKFLEARDFKVKAAEKMLEDHMKWRKETLPIKRSCFENQEFVTSGAMYHFGFDKDGSPIMVIRSSLFLPKTRDLEACTNYMSFMILYMSAKFPRHERFTVLYDRNNFSLRKNLDLDLIKNAAKVMSDNFPESLKRAYICPSGSVLRGIWKIAKHFFDPETRKKIAFLPSTKHFIKYIDPEQLEARYDGTSDFSFTFKAEDLPEEVGVVDPWL